MLLFYYFMFDENKCPFVYGCYDEFAHTVAIPFASFRINLQYLPSGQPNFVLLKHCLYMQFLIQNRKKYGTFLNAWKMKSKSLFDHSFAAIYFLINLHENNPISSLWLCSICVAQKQLMGKSSKISKQYTANHLKWSAAAHKLCVCVCVMEVARDLSLICL